MEFATLNMDTYKVVNLLREKGYSKEEAEGFIAAIQEITLTGVATKQDINQLKEATMQNINELREEIQNSKLETLKFQLIQTIAIIGVMVALFQIFG